MDLEKAKAAIDVDAARAFRNRSSFELRGLVTFLRQQIVECEWEIAKAQQSIKAYQDVIEKIESSQNAETK